MALDITTREQESIEILHLRGRLTLGEEDLVLQNEINKAAAAGRTRLVLDLGKVTDIDTTGLGTLVSAQTRLRNAGGGLALANLHPAHMELLVVAKVEAIFEVFVDDQNAINSFFPDRQIPRIDILEFVRSTGREQVKP